MNIKISNLWSFPFKDPIRFYNKSPIKLLEHRYWYFQKITWEPLCSTLRKCGPFQNLWIQNPLHVSLEWKIQRCRLRPTMHEIYLNVTIMLSDSSSMNLSSKAFSGSKFFKNCNTSCLCWMKVDTCTSS